jgi:hypothetical protein
MSEQRPENTALSGIIEGGWDIRKYLSRFYTEEWVFALLSLGFTFGWSVSGFPPSIELACVCWGITLVIALHYFLVWSIRNLALALNLQRAYTLFRSSSAPKSVSPMPERQSRFFVNRSDTSHFLF